MAFKAPYHQSTKLLNRCLQLGDEELFALILCSKVTPVWGRASSGKIAPRTESYLQQSFISLGFSNLQMHYLNAYLKTCSVEETLKCHPPCFCLSTRLSALA